MAQQVKNKQTNFNGLNYICFENVFFSGEMDDFFCDNNNECGKNFKTVWLLYTNSRLLCISYLRIIGAKPIAML